MIEAIKAELRRRIKRLVTDVTIPIDELYCNTIKANELRSVLSFIESLEKEPKWEPSKESMEALLLAIEGKCPSPTSYMSRRLEDLYEGLVNTYHIDEDYVNRD